MEKMKIASVGRIIYALALLVFGVLHFTGAEILTKLIPSYMPFGPKFWVFFVGVAMIITAFSIILRKNERIACLLLALMFTMFILMVRVPAVFKTSDGERLNVLIEIVKELALAGSALVIAGNKEKS